MERLVMIGRDYPELGSIHQQGLHGVLGCVSAGSDADAPSFAFKGDKGVCPNEDGLVVLKDENRWLLAVADGHLGHESSHAILEGLSQLAKVPSRLGPLSLALTSNEWIEETRGGTTLLVACCDQSTGAVFGLSFGDSSLVVLSSSGAQVKNQPNNSYLRGGGPVEVELGRPFSFQLNPDEIMLLYTDGVNECCYRDPYRSIRLSHLEQLFQEHSANLEKFTRALMELALSGVDGHPGGQDNVVIVAFPFNPS